MQAWVVSMLECGRGGYIVHVWRLDLQQLLGAGEMLPCLHQVAHAQVRLPNLPLVRRRLRARTDAPVTVRKQGPSHRPKAGLREGAEWEATRASPLRVRGGAQRHTCSREPSLSSCAVLMLVPERFDARLEHSER